MKTELKIAYRYADALYQAASDKNSVNTVSEQLQVIRHAFASYQNLHNSIIEKVYLSLKDKLDPLLQNTLALMHQNNRIALLPLLPEAWSQVRYQHIPVTITTPKALNDVEKQDIEKLVRQHVAKDAVLNISFIVDPDVIAGVAVKIGDKLVDNTWRHRLNQLKLSLQQAA